MIYESQEKKAIVIFTAKLARQLLKKGYVIIDIKPDKKNKIASVYVFRYEDGISQIISELSSEDIFAE